MEGSKGVFRKPRRDYVEDCPGSISQYKFNVDSLCKVSDYEIVECKENMPNLEMLTYEERAAFWLYKHQFADSDTVRNYIVNKKAENTTSNNTDIINRTDDMTEINNPSQMTTRKSQNSQSGSMEKINPHLKGKAIMNKRGKDFPKNNYIGIKCHDEYLNLEDIQKDIDNKFSIPPQTHQIYNVELDNTVPDMISYDLRKQEFNEVLNTNQIIEKSIANNKILQCTIEADSIKVDMGIQWESSQETRNTQTDSELLPYIILPASPPKREKKMNKEDILSLLKSSCYDTSSFFGGNKDFRIPKEPKPLKTSNSVDETCKLSKGTQMFEHVTENDLYTMDWINYNLFNININPYTLVIDEKLQDVSEVATYSESKQSCCGGDAKYSPSSIMSFSLK